MSAGAIFQEVLRVLNHQDLPRVAQGDVLAALEAAHPGPLASLYEAGAEAGLPSRQLLTRAAAIYFNFCAGNLSDDLSDGDCDYLSDPYRLGPCTQLILQCLFFHTLAKAKLPNPLVAAVSSELVTAVGPQHIELRTKRWTPSVFRQVADGIAGRQWSAYFQILWHGTPLARRAVGVGMKLGRAGIVAGDIRSGDPRYTTLSRPGQREVVAWAREASQALRAEELCCVDTMLDWIDAVLEAA